MTSAVSYRRLKFTGKISQPELFFTVFIFLYCNRSQSFRRESYRFQNCVGKHYWTNINFMLIAHSFIAVIGMFKWNRTVKLVWIDQCRLIRGILTCLSIWWSALHSLRHKKLPPIHKSPHTKLMSTNSDIRDNLKMNSQSLLKGVQ